MMSRFDVGLRNICRRWVRPWGVEANGWRRPYIERFSFSAELLESTLQAWLFGCDSWLIICKDRRDSSLIKTWSNKLNIVMDTTLNRFSVLKLPKEDASERRRCSSVKMAPAQLNCSYEYSHRYEFWWCDCLLTDATLSRSIKEPHRISFMQWGSWWSEFCGAWIMFSPDCLSRFDGDAIGNEETPWGYSDDNSSQANMCEKSEEDIRCKTSPDTQTKKKLIWSAISMLNVQENAYRWHSFQHAFQQRWGVFLEPAVTSELSLPARNWEIALLHFRSP